MTLTLEFPMTLHTVNSMRWNPHASMGAVRARSPRSDGSARSRKMVVPHQQFPRKYEDFPPPGIDFSKEMTARVGPLHPHLHGAPMLVLDQDDERPFLHGLPFRLALKGRRSIVGWGDAAGHRDQRGEDESSFPEGSCTFKPRHIFLFFLSQARSLGSKPWFLGW